MGFLGQGLQRTARTAPGVLQIVGMDYISAAGAFNWPVPAGVDVLDIVAVGGGGAESTGNYSSSGAICQRVGKSVIPGQTISGYVGAGANSSGSGVFGEATTVDGMSAGGGSNTSTAQPRGTATGGDVNLTGVSPQYAGAGISSLTRQTVEAFSSTDYGVRINNLSFNGNPCTTLSTANAPGGGAYASGGTISGAPGGVIFIMYRRAT